MNRRRERQQRVEGELDHRFGPAELLIPIHDQGETNFGFLGLRVASPVAQICNLPYRRVALCCAADHPQYPFSPTAWPIANRRYSRLKICATGAGFRRRRPVQFILKANRNYTANTGLRWPVSFSVPS